MLHKKQRIWCFIVACVVLLAGMYTTFQKADSFGNRAIIMDSTIRDEAESMQKLTQAKNVSMQEQVYLTSRTMTRIGQMFSRFAGRDSSVRKDLRLSLFILWEIITTYFLLRYFQEEDALCLHEKEYWRALIKYIHDIDGKKRETCLI